MDSTTLSAIVSTVIPFITFLGIVAWAWSRRRTAAFRDAAEAPFALPDEAAEAPFARPDETAPPAPGEAARERAR